MALTKSNKKCGCGKKRLVSRGAKDCGKCFDVCTTPLCGTPDALTLLAPVVYDEIGINLCRSIPLTLTLPAPSRTYTASAQILGVDFNARETETTTIARISGRPSCHRINLTNLTISANITIYDENKNIVSSEIITPRYLPTNPDVPDYAYEDEETNPTNVELELFSPYGVSVNSETPTTPIMNYLGFTDANNNLRQGLNMIAIPKVLDFDTTSANPIVTLGITFYIKSVYFAQYLIPHKGRAIVPKGSIMPDEQSVCEEFVSGSLLDYEIKPLELGPKDCENKLKNDCNDLKNNLDCCPPSHPSSRCDETKKTDESFLDGLDLSTNFF